MKLLEGHGGPPDDLDRPRLQSTTPIASGEGGDDDVCPALGIKDPRQVLEESADHLATRLPAGPSGFGGFVLIPRQIGRVEGYDIEGAPKRAQQVGPHEGKA